jgi:D-alanyl-D-alanine carboxypeptidase
MDSYRWKLAASALVIGATVGGCSALNVTSRPSAAHAPQLAEAANSDVGAQLARKAEASLTAGKFSDAVNFAEGAVTADPRNGAHRALLGQAYLQEGRFSAASMALSEAAELGAVKGDAVVSLALAKIAEGDRYGAVQWLSDNSDGLTSSDLGLALSLAGDHEGALYVLGNAIREPDASAQTRQNFSLALAMAGKWAQSRLIAAQDLPLARVEKRMLEFSSIASTQDKKTQIASLMGIKVRGDAGMPAQLALQNFTASPIMAEAEPEAVRVADAGAMISDMVTEAEAAPVDAPAPVAVRVAAVEPPASAVAAMVAVVDAAPVRAVPMAAAVEGDAAETLAPAVMLAAFDAESAEAVAPVMAVQTEDEAPVSMEALTAVFEQKMARAEAGEALAAASWSVQVASLDSAENAKLAWYDLTARRPVTARYAASTHLARVGTRAYYRLTLDGLPSKQDAQRLCNQLQAAKQDCFVRQNGSAQPLWAVRAQTMQLAMR